MKCGLLHSDTSPKDYRFYSSRTSARSSSVSPAAPQASTDYSPSLLPVFFKELGLLKGTELTVLSLKAPFRNQEHLNESECPILTSDKDKVYYIEISQSPSHSDQYSL